MTPGEARVVAGTVTLGILGVIRAAMPGVTKAVGAVGIRVPGGVKAVVMTRGGVNVVEFIFWEIVKYKSD